MRSRSTELRLRVRVLLQSLISLYALVSPGGVAGVAHADQGAAVKPRHFAILIGCERYAKANPLSFIDNDVKQLATTLEKHGGYERELMLEMTDQASEPVNQPVKASLLDNLPAWLKRPDPADTVLVYFSGHGFRDADGKMYLAPLDVDPQNPAATGIPVEWLREQIAACPAGFKLLLLDACHAGSEKGAGPAEAPAKDLGQMFGDVEKVVTIASSTADQKSQLWADKQQSLFSYWLNQGLKGHADADGDGQVDIDELYKYVSRTVSHTAETTLGRAQTPVRIVRSGTIDVPAIVTLRPQRLKQVLADMSELLANACGEHQLKALGVLEFTNFTPGGEEVLGGPFGLLGRHCAEELEKRLIDEGTGKFSVVDQRRLQKALSERRFGLADLGSGAALKSLGDSTGAPAIVQGALRSREGSVVTLQCRLVETRGDKTLASVGGLAALTESEWAMLGRSVFVKPDDRRPVNDRPREQQVIERMDDRAHGANPLLDPSFPFRVTLVIDGKDRPGVARGNDYFVPVRKGEIYMIKIENRTPQMAMMRVLVDGLNTLPERSAKGIVTTQWGQHVNLDEARPWELDPNSAKGIRGFTTEVGTQGKYKEFVVTDAEQSLAARRQFTDQMGIITVAFYAPKGGTRQLGTAAGREVDQKYESSRGMQCGNLLGVVHLRYVEAEALRMAGR